MRLLFIVANFIPEIGSAAHIYFDLAKAFVQMGHEVDVITSYPRDFYLDKDDVKKVYPLDENISGVIVHRCNHNAVRDNILIRGMEHFLLPLYYFRVYQKLAKKFDVCLIYIPPLPLYYFAGAIKKFSGIPSVLNFQDFHPQELTDVGILKNGLIIKVMEYIERESYKNADFITVLSEGGIDYVARRGGCLSKIKHIYNGCMISDRGEPSKKPDFKSIMGIEDKLLITYAGILSPFQGLNNILDAAKNLKDHIDIVFYIVGDGLIKEQLEQRIASENILNVKMLPLQSRDKYINIIRSSDISLISLDLRMKAPCIPGKVLNLMAEKVPLIAIVPLDCETARVIKNSNCGVIAPPEDVDELSEAILRLKTNPLLLKQFGENGRKFFENNFDLSRNVIILENVFKEVINQNR